MGVESVRNNNYPAFLAYGLTNRGVCGLIAAPPTGLFLYGVYHLIPCTTAQSAVLPRLSARISCPQKTPDDQPNGSHDFVSRRKIAKILQGYSFRTILAYNSYHLTSLPWPTRLRPSASRRISSKSSTLGPSSSARHGESADMEWILGAVSHPVNGRGPTDRHIKCCLNTCNITDLE